MMYVMRILVVDWIGVVYCLYRFLKNGFYLIIRELKDFYWKVLVMVDVMEIWLFNGVKKIFCMKCYLKIDFCFCEWFLLEDFIGDLYDWKGFSFEALFERGFLFVGGFLLKGFLYV